MKSFKEILMEEKNTTPYEMLQQVRRDLTNISSNVASIVSLSKRDKEVSDDLKKASKEVEKLIDKARRIIFDVHK